MKGMNFAVLLGTERLGFKLLCEGGGRELQPLCLCTCVCWEEREIGLVSVLVLPPKYI